MHGQCFASAKLHTGILHIAGKRQRLIKTHRNSVRRSTTKDHTFASTRRRRPFVFLIEAIIVGRKPGSYSFPWGHSAAAFAAALLLTREYPGSAHGFFGLASLVAFSRIYLGVHYPGDLLSGSLPGMVLARFYSCVLRKIGVATE